MSLTALVAIVALLLLGTVFGIAYKWKGMKAAWLAAGVALVIEIVAFFAMIAAIVSVMPN